MKPRSSVGVHAYDGAMSTTPLLAAAENERVSALGGLDSSTQSALGQFFTPVLAANLIASIPSLPSNGWIRVLDPGAGSGMLSAALVNRVLTEREDLKVEIVAIERDPKLIHHLKATLAACEEADRDRVKTKIIRADFILDSVGLGATLDLDAHFDLVIENPPYGKLSASSEQRKAMRAAGLDAPNLYAAFLSLSIAALKRGGQIVAITPRSFFNGPYFGEFRTHLLSMIALEHIHVFDSRSSVFSDTGVLQENVIFHGRRGAQPEIVEISTSRDHLTAATSRKVPYSEVVFQEDPNRFIRLSTNEEDTKVAETVLSQPCSLTELGVQVSTGRVVDFRARHALSSTPREGAVPLIYPGNLRNGAFEWPRDIRKPQWFRPTKDKDHSLLLPEGWYTVVKRFSSKEERRRIVASVWSPIETPGSIAFENHLNVFHVNGVGMDESLAKGIAIWLNSSVIDRFFRTFSGHTQVNASDLRTLRFPTVDTLRGLGAKYHSTQTEVDFLVDKLVAA